MSEAQSFSKHGSPPAQSQDQYHQFSAKNIPSVALFPGGPPQTPIQLNPQNINHYRSTVIVLAIVDLIQNTFFLLMWLLTILDLIIYYIKTGVSASSTAALAPRPKIDAAVTLTFGILLLIVYVVGFSLDGTLLKMIDPRVSSIQAKSQSCWWSLANIPIISLEYIHFLWSISDKHKVNIFMQDTILYHYGLLLSISVRCVILYLVSGFRKRIVAGPVLSAIPIQNAQRRP